MILPLRTTQTMFDDATVSRVDVVAGEGARRPRWRRDRRRPHEPGVRVSSPADVGHSLAQVHADFRSDDLIAAVALFVGAFLIFNTFR